MKQFGNKYKQEAAVTQAHLKNFPYNNRKMVSKLSKELGVNALKFISRVL